MNDNASDEPGILPHVAPRDAELPTSGIQKDGSVGLPDPADHAKAMVEQHKEELKEKDKRHRPLSESHKRAIKRGKRKAAKERKARRESHDSGTAALIVKIEALRDQAKDELERIEAALSDLRKVK